MNPHMCWRESPYRSAANIGNPMMGRIAMTKSLLFQSALAFLVASFFVALTVYLPFHLVQNHPHGILRISPEIDACDRAPSHATGDEEQQCNRGWIRILAILILQSTILGFLILATLPSKFEIAKIAGLTAGMVATLWTGLFLFSWLFSRISMELPVEFPADKNPILVVIPVLTVLISPWFLSAFKLAKKPAKTDFISPKR